MPGKTPRVVEGAGRRPKDEGRPPPSNEMRGEWARGPAVGVLRGMRAVRCGLALLLQCEAHPRQADASKPLPQAPGSLSQHILRLPRRLAWNATPAYGARRLAAAEGASAPASAHQLPNSNCAAAVGCVCCNITQ